MKKVLVAFIAILLFATLGLAQVWVYDSIFKEGSQPHGVVVDPEGKIWIHYYGVLETLENGKSACPLFIYNPDGNEATFSPIMTFDNNGTPDTLRYRSRGVSLDKDGNVMVSSGYLYRFNYQTGEFMNRYDYDNDWWSLTEAAADDNGFIYLARVASGNALHIINEDFEYYSNVADMVPTLQRSILVSKDGNNVYVGTIYSGVNGIRVYESVEGLGPDGEYALVDTIGTVFNEDRTARHNMWGQCLDWDANGLMWVGTYWDVGANDFSGWYALDPTQSWGIVDTIGHNVGIGVAPTAGVIPEGSAFHSPRGIAFSPDGKTAYIADFDGGVIKKFTNDNPKGPGSPIIGLEELVVVSLREDGKPVIVVNFDLKQNYPNPFNPKTRIPFDISENVHVKLVVYDVNGRLVKTLVDQQLTPQRYEYEFDGSDLASGTYFYQLDVNGVLITKQMMLIK